MDSKFPFVFPVLSDCFEKCNVLNLFRKCIAHLPSEIQYFLNQKLISPLWIKRRLRAGERNDIPYNDDIKSLLSCLDVCPPIAQPYAVAAIAILSGLTLDFIIEQAGIKIESRQHTVLKSMVDSTREKYPAPVFTFFDRIEYTEHAEAIPSTYNFTMQGNPFNCLPIESEDFLADCMNAVPPDDFEVHWHFDPDISGGFNCEHGITEVPCTNDIDEHWVRPMQWIADLEVPPVVCKHCVGCDCLCSDCSECHILTFDDGKKTMSYTEDGKLNMTMLTQGYRPLIIECNAACGCDKAFCKNCVVHKRSNIHLLVFHSLTKSGWGARTLDFIPRGTFVCEYLGGVITDPTEAERTGQRYDLSGESYLFDLDAYNVPDNEMFTVDPSLKGNVSKFINHNCEPNLVQISIGTVEDRTMHRIAFFSLRDIYPNEELGFHYNYQFDHDESRMIPCNCGSLFCRSRLR